MSSYTRSCRGNLPSWWGMLTLCVVWLTLLTGCPSGGSGGGDDDDDDEPQNRRPVASFTTSTTSGPAPLDVDFDASGSSDRDGNVVDYVWVFGDGGELCASSVVELSRPE